MHTDRTSVSSKLLTGRNTDNKIATDKWEFEATHWKFVIPLAEAEDLNFAAEISFGFAGES